MHLLFCIILGAAGVQAFTGNILKLPSRLELDFKKQANVPEEEKPKYGWMKFIPPIIRARCRRACVQKKLEFS